MCAHKCTDNINSKFKCRQRLRYYQLVKNSQRSSMYACGFLLAGA
jgi:hypothetical protein